MYRVNSEEDFRNGVVTYEMDDGKRVCLDAKAVELYGAVKLLAEHGYKPPTERLPIFQFGHKVGTVPGAFDPFDIRSTSFLYQPRSGDFVRVAEGWAAGNTLGPGDLEAVPGFVWERDSGRLPEG